MSPPQTSNSDGAATLLHVYSKLKSLRTRTDLSLKPTKYLRKTFVGMDGTERDLRLRYYQVQGILHLIFMRRFLLGDDTGLGKTIQVIGALTYIWATEPNTKVVVLTTKTAARQWIREIDRFAEGVTTLLCVGTPLQREKVRKKFAESSGPTVMVMGYRTAVQDFSSLQDLQGYVFVTDECFDYFTPVVLADGSTELIGKIVSNRMEVSVLSYNWQTGRCEPKPIINWYRKPLVSGRRTGLLRITFRYSESVRVTGSHEFYRPDGTKAPAYRLKVGDPVVHFSPTVPTEHQCQLIFGSLLGDASILNPKRNLNGVAFGHSVAQEALLRFKHEVLSPLGVSGIWRGKNGGFKKKDGTAKEQVKFGLHGNATVSAIMAKARIHREGKKRVTAEWLDQVGPLGLAVWYADDGTLRRSEHTDGSTSLMIDLCTHDFTLEEQELLVGWLRWRWGVHAQIRFERKRAERNTGLRRVYPYLHLDRDATSRFFSLLPGALPGVEHKYPEGMPLLRPSDLRTQPAPGLVQDSIQSITPYTPPQNQKYVYDIEVEGNHNYFANGTLVSNCTAYKNPKAQVSKVVRYLGSRAGRMWALTATLIKNTLVDGFGIYNALLPGFFGSYQHFLNEYCVIRMQTIPRSRRQVPIIVGYRESGIAAFRQKIDPYFLGRAKHEVASELPPLTQEVIEVGLSDFQAAKYAEALTGLLEIDKTGDTKEVTKLTAITYCQEIANHLGLIDCEGESEKLDALLDLLTDSDLAGEKVIVFTRFERMVGIIEQALTERKVKVVRITGAEDVNQRDDSQTKFQTPGSGYNVICITTAGSEAVNLQAAKAIVFVDTPWTPGDYIQILGRMIRIGSIHDRVFAYHLVAKDTIDAHVMRVLKKKLEVVEKVLGKRIKGDKDDAVVVMQENDISNLFDTLRQDARAAAGS